MSTATVSETSEEHLNDAAVRLAIGRIFRLASRPSQPGDIEQYESCRRLIMDILDPANTATTGYQPNWARDRHGSVMRGER